MYNTLVRMRKLGKLADYQVDAAVSKHWITEAQGEYIKSIPVPNAE